uniref:Tudor domain-containing protein n=1 Tax=Anisakis simplex TaxID=6269 RepID=A0A0M3JJI7_ANISI
LYIVYKNSRGKYFHYPILERYDENLKTSLLYVDYGDDRCAEFMRLGALIKYYCERVHTKTKLNFSTYASLHSYSQ